MGTSKLLGDNLTKCWEVTRLRWTSIPSRGSRNTPSRFILQKPDISAGLMGLLDRPISIEADFTFLPYRLNEASAVVCLKEQCTVPVKPLSCCRRLLCLQCVMIPGFFLACGYLCQLCVCCQS